MDSYVSFDEVIEVDLNEFKHIPRKSSEQKEEKYHPFEWIAETTYPVINAFNSAALALTAAALMTIDTDDEERDDVTKILLLISIILNFYGFLIQGIKQYMPHWMSDNLEGFDKLFWAIANGAAAHFFSLQISENAYIEQMTNGAGATEEVIVTPQFFALLNIIPVTLGLSQIVSELCPDDWRRVKKFKHLVLDPLEKISIVEGTVESVEDLSKFARTSSAKEMIPRYGISGAVGLLMSYRAYKERQGAGEEKELPAYQSLPVFLEESLSAFTLALYQFQKSSKIFDSSAFNAMVVLMCFMGASSIVARGYFGKPVSKSEVKIEEVKQEDDVMPVEEPPQSLSPSSSLRLS